MSWWKNILDDVRRYGSPFAQVTDPYRYLSANLVEEARDVWPEASQPASQQALRELCQLTHSLDHTLTHYRARIRPVCFYDFPFHRVQHYLTCTSPIRNGIHRRRRGPRGQHREPVHHLPRQEHARDQQEALRHAQDRRCDRSAPQCLS